MKGREKRGVRAGEGGKETGSVFVFFAETLGKKEDQVDHYYHHPMISRTKGGIVIGGMFDLFIFTRESEKGKKDVIADKKGEGGRHFVVKKKK